MDTITAMLAGEQFAIRRAVGRRVCEGFGFRDRLGRLQVATCLKALSVLAECSERIVLPTPAAVVSGRGKPSLVAAGAGLAENRPKCTPREIEVVHPSYQPSRAELREDLRIGSSLDDFERAPKALVRPVRVRCVSSPKRLSP